MILQGDSTDENAHPHTSILIVASAIILTGGALAQRKVQPDDKPRMELNSLTATNSSSAAVQKTSTDVQHSESSDNEKAGTPDVDTVHASRWSTIKRRASQVGVVALHVATTSALPVLAGPAAPALEIASQVHASRLASQAAIAQPQTNAQAPTGQSPAPNQNAPAPNEVEASGK
ncbi:MAG TPA: hypothetical protein VF753_03770 [Terriglobales bacterium]